LRRRRVPEQMDDPLLDARAHREALQSLNRVNGLFRIHHRMMRAAIELAGSSAFSLLDLGAGGGGLLEHAVISDRIDSGTETMRIGLDASMQALIAGRGWSTGGIHWIAGDARQIPLSDSSIDVVVSSLFLHHFDADDVAAILRESLRVARIGIVMSDLTRSWYSLALTWFGTRVSSRSRVFRVDGPRSVRAAWSPRELRALALQAGLARPIISLQFPFRMLLTCGKAPHEGGTLQ
jgi:ubiquinone/menaquinone biosynthesis C-methylase UbiE